MKTIAAIAMLFLASVSIDETKAIQLNARITFTDDVEKLLEEEN